LNILQNVLKTVAVRWDQFLGQSVKHKGIIRIRRMAEREFLLFHCCDCRSEEATNAKRISLVVQPSRL